MTNTEKILNRARFAETIQAAKVPEQPDDISGTVAKAEDNLPPCADPNCTCLMNFKNFRPLPNLNVTGED